MKVQTETKAKGATKPKEPVFNTPYEKAAGIHIALMGVIALFIPADILQTHAWAVEFTDFMAAWVPQINLITNLDIRPDLNRFYYSVIWAMSPILFVICALMSWDGRQRTYPFWNLPFSKSLPIVLVGVAFLFAAGNGGWITNSSNGVLRFMLSNRLAMGALGNIFYVSFPVMLAGGLLAFCVGWIGGEIPRHIQHQTLKER